MKAQEWERLLMEDGELRKLLSLVKKKLAKGLDISTIAEHTEEDPSFIQQICDALETNPESTIEDLIAKIKQ